MQDTLVIVDDHEAFRSIARARFEADGMEVVGEAADGRSGLDVIASLRPTVALVDVHLPDIDGWDLARHVASWDHPPLIVLTSSRPRTNVRRLLAASGAAGFIAKEDLTGAAVRALLSGRW